MVRREIARRGALGLGLGAALAGCQAAPRQSPSAAPVPPPSATTSATSATTTAPRPSGPAQQLVRSESGRPEVALTFHGAGDLSITRRVLDVLAQHDARVTVLAVGTWLASTPDGIRMVRDGGHEIGNHTWSHGDLARMPVNPMLTEIERCRDELARLTGGPGTFFRQSQGQYATDTELAEAGKAGYERVLSYDVDSLDWTDPAPDRIRRAVAAARAGSVVSMHLGHPATVTALPGVLADLAERGLRPVTATQLFA
ncbi:peptidoglycan/xylan/chitin deacetylase (PgdA/CDA1 family) [Amycolatopsis bartoniae]|uniref:Polysaccharide deacetylase n=1 Tax=Amycolatopsis bartoniae TaxID=941986 RepID=A0A8H9IVP4_9PSEU|nr:polysaccharide deacetylase family protein [Amycolatopsis bartoniae]MBB2939458.1 peptidoglycan/xylan/chitin deacetylase (PgdA/CDA1 family) [Amycolatopsis bartoniae]TVT11332.1 polysaccharide deacetylase family protein [Amycolatopsis bartoniae]GHF66767.1 polysaccharide deacetylase [Amycolatopsis bartoniae]